jgi:CMP-N-acetylneuraminic acid synthetase
MAVLGLVPARGGSKGIAGKNLAPLRGKPLLAYTCEAARASRSLTRVVVSTDSKEIAAAARSLGVEVPFLRPASLAGDDVPMLDVVRHALDELGDPEAVVLLQPTSPLRRAEHVDAAVELWRATGADSVVSAVRVPHHLTPGSLLVLGEDGRLAPLQPGPTLRQGKPVLYARNGPAVLVVRPSVVRAGSLYGEDSRALVMAAEDSLDVDEPFDLELAEFILARRAARESEP